MIEPINETTFRLKMVEDEVEIGDINAAEFKPHVKLKRWGEECFINLGLATMEKKLPMIQGDKILWQGRNYGAEFLSTQDGFKFNIILPKKPKTNVFPLDFGSDNLKFYYQPPLTEEFKAGYSQEFQRDILVGETQVVDLDGNVLVGRPDNVVGSYAVYHATRGNIHHSKEDAKKYKCGKAFHWYRPLIWDAVGKKCWGELNVDLKVGIRTVTIPRDFLDSAVYPVTIDDTFGFDPESHPNTSSSTGNIIYGNDYTSGVAGVAVSMSFYSDTEESSNTWRPCLYLVSDHSLIDYGAEHVHASNPGWEAQALTQSGVIPASTEFHLGIWFKSLTTYFYDAVGLTRFYDAEGYHATNPPVNPLVPTYSGDRKIGIYCTYTPEVGPTNYDRSASVLVGNLASASRLLAIDRDSAILVGNLVSAFKSWGIPKTTSVLVGNLVSATVIEGVYKVSAVLVGNLTSATRAVAVTRASSVLIGNLVSATRIRGAVRTSLVLIGNLVAATRLSGLTRTSSVLIGNLVSAIKTWNRLNIGALAIDRASSTAGGFTLIAKENPANFTGTLTQVEIYPDEGMTVVKVGTFYGTPPNFACRDYAVIGIVAAGKQIIKDLDIDAETGDYIGIYFE